MFFDCFLLTVRYIGSGGGVLRGSLPPPTPRTEKVDPILTDGVSGERLQSGCASFWM